ncbi:SAM-dependent methyltransferase, partial [Streptomyces sp. SID5910]|uniref:SAM-dependent methyltransferase n=1 Tax=Streptomyces sp. SID5910 TaxID=2690312 RepID=UPI00136823B5|nr:hypothetical protein [Streptomyces sp. SID5910]
MSPTTFPACPEHGHVTFLGAGPGDPGLLTLRAVEALANADVLVAEHEVLDVVRTHARQGVAEVHTDADPSDPGAGTPQLTVVDGASTAVGVPAVRDAAHLVMEAARGGRRVVRAVTGDPGLDTYAAEEMLACAAAGVPFEVVPGIANAVGVPAYAGVPLRDAEGADVRFVDARTASDRCWTEVGASDGTVVVSTTLDSVAAAAGELVSAGRKPDTPLTVTIAGTTTRQRTWTATLGTVAQTLKQAKVLPSPDGGRPVIAVVGERSASARRDQLSWFESKPLFGWKVLVPRTKEQAASLSDQLRSYGAVPHEVPTIAVEPPRTPQQMERAVKGLVTGRYEWIAFTSVNAVKAVREKFEEYGLDARAFAGIKVAAVGEQTAKALIAFGVKPDLVPSGEQSAAGLLEDWPPYDPVFDPIDRVFLPRADIPDRFTVPASAPGLAGELRVPRYSQEIHKGQYPEYDNGGEAWCSPTSSQMIVEYWGGRLTKQQLAWVDPSYADPQVCHAARYTYDFQYAGCGNWPFNAAYAATFPGLQGVVTRLGSLTDLETLIAAGIPAITSQSFLEKELTGAGYGTSGHLMTVIGFTADG